MNNSFLMFLGICQKSRSLSLGYNKTEEEIKRGKVKLLILSNDVSENTLKKFTNYSLKYKFSLIKIFNKEELGTSIGREEISVIGVLDKNMAEKLLSLYKLSN